jgi:PhzF family phenazine biosynthesis protein
LKAFIVDSFTTSPFKGNPAGVCLVDHELTDRTMLDIAQELGLSETSFIRQTSPNQFSIRFFSPRMEIPLCGHATLASAKVVFHEFGIQLVAFENRNGTMLTCRQVGDAIAMVFPQYQTHDATVSREMLHALGLESIEDARYNEETNILMLRIASTEELAKISPDYSALVKTHDSINGVLITAKCEDDSSDYHLRYFWPWSGTNEDPVTGAIQTFLGPYWSGILGKTEMRSFQSSARTGSMNVNVSVRDMQITILGEAVIVFEGSLFY